MAGIDHLYSAHSEYACIGSARSMETAKAGDRRAGRIGLRSALTYHPLWAIQSDTFN